MRICHIKKVNQRKRTVLEKKRLKHLQLARGSKRNQLQSADENTQILTTMTMSKTRETSDIDDVEQIQHTSSDTTSDSAKEVNINVVFRYNYIYLLEIHL